MSPRLTPTELMEQLAAGSIVSLNEKTWAAVAGHFRLVEDIDTHMSGRILLVRRPAHGGKRGGWAIVEEPEPRQKVVRPLKNEKEARALIADRLAAYERMWDG